MTIAEIQDLFDRARHVCSMLGNAFEGAEVSIFRSVYPDKAEASQRLGKFVIDVGTCPTEVLDYTTALIARKKKESLKKVV